MTLVSLLEALIMLAVLCLFGIFTSNYISKQFSNSDYKPRIINKISFELKAIFGTLLIVITLIALVYGGYLGISYFALLK